MSDVNDVVPPVDNLDSEEENEEQVNRYGDYCKPHLRLFARPTHANGEY